jgi:prepilin-type N-terminal cleavage/methylation domain-containing protein
MLKKLQKSNKGFTIIEVMIVLAIAALILLIVLLAVPALQRNSRNTAIKNDASAVVGGVSEFESNNDGKTPKGGAGNTTCNAGDISLSAGATTTPSKPKIQGSTAVDCATTGTHTYTLTDSDTGKLFLNFGAKCPDTVSGKSVTTVTSTRSTAVVYAIEANSDIQAKCVDG